MGKSERLGRDDTFANPGPGSYNPKSVFA